MKNAMPDTERRVRRALEIIDVCNEARVLPERERALRAMTPRALEAKLKERVVGQDAAVRDISLATCLWLRHSFLCRDGVYGFEDVPEPRHLFITGSTASGKSFLVKALAEALGLKLVSVNAATLTGEGWRGQSLSTYLKSISDEQKEDPDAMHLLLIDEICKTCHLGEKDGDIGFNPQTDILAISGSRTYEAFGKDGCGDERLFTVDMTRVLVVSVGAFSGIERIVRSRLMRNAEGEYGLLDSGEATKVAAMQTEDLRPLIEPCDLIAAGMLAEYVGRSRLVAMPTLSEDALVSICTGSQSSLEEKYGRLLPGDAKFLIEEDAARAIARKARTNELGARYLDSAISGFAAQAYEAALDGLITHARVILEDSELKLKFSLVLPKTRQ